MKGIWLAEGNWKVHDDKLHQVLLLLTYSMEQSPF